MLAGVISNVFENVNISGSAPLKTSKSPTRQADAPRYKRCR
uniref:Uncharacterized protein n=1 Tax=uncultured Chromatiales bacterium HF0200_41F04 TaxID=710740 RepID=E0XV14_9GAMM|nr:hypothetical protein [uncultured Chromatiales bacterium HF0200_41F04]